MRSGDKEQGAIEFGDVIQEDHDADNRVSGYLVLVAPIDIVLMPGPHLTRKCLFEVDLKLMDVDVIFQNLSRRHQHFRQSCQGVEVLVVQMAAMKSAVALAVLLEDMSGKGLLFKLADAIE